MDAAADGYVRGEACCTIIISAMQESSGSNGGFEKPLAVIRGSAVNQDGRSSSLTAPNGPSQQDAIQQALQAAAVDSGAMDGLSMHGTGACTFQSLMHFYFLAQHWTCSRLSISWQTMAISQLACNPAVA